MKQLRTVRTSPNHPQTSLTEKKNTKSNELSHTDSLGDQNDFNTSSNGRDTLKATTHGNQLIKSMPLNLSNIINPQFTISQLLGQHINPQFAISQPLSQN